MDTETFQPIVAQYETARVWTWLILARNTTLLYYYATTFDEEVAKVWPQPNLKLGKVLFLTTRYSAIIGVAVTVPQDVPSYANVGVKGCIILSRVYDVVRPIAGTCSEAMLWVFLYALLEGGRWPFYLLMGAFLSLTVPSQIMTWINSSGMLSVPPDPLSQYLGYACSWDVSQTNPTLVLASAYLTLARAIFGLNIGAFTLARRFRKHNNLITVIIREGGMYYCSTCILLLFNALLATPDFPVKDKYQVVSTLAWLLMLIFSDRLLLNLQGVERFETRGTVSELIFAPNKPQATAGSEPHREDHQSIQLQPINYHIPSRMENSERVSRELHPFRCGMI